ncbi:MAG: right-handed parallel beta-helix repeat-containing protein [Deltaproteobacteria bacterium]|nr:right-handed parallel beta-helix repeat-containing protein [Deltaproteobacteria bacterium]
MMRSRRDACCLFLLSLLFVAVTQEAAHAETVTASVGADVESIIRGLAPGDELILEDGLYDITDADAPPFGRFAISVAGTSALPIVIRAADGANPHFYRGNAEQNIWDITGANLIVRGLTFSGGSIGLRIEGAENLTVEDCEIYGTEGPGIAAPIFGATYDGLRIVRNRVHDTGGGGMRFGCEGDFCRVANSEISQNHVHHIAGSGEGILIREGGYANRIIDNVLHDTAGPCIATLGTLGNGDDQVISANLLFRCGENGIQAAAEAVITNNVILSAGVEGISMRPYASPDPDVFASPANLAVVHNTVLMPSGHAVALAGAVGPIVVANNALYAQAGLPVFVFDGTTFLSTRGNEGLGLWAGESVGDGDLVADFVDANFSGAPPMDVFPKALGALVGAGSTTDVVEFDFNGTARAGVADVGAYAFDSSGNPGWILAPVMKGEVYVPGPDAGVPDGSVETDGSTPDGSVETDGSTPDGSVEPDGSTPDGSVEPDGSTPDGSVETDGSTPDGSVETDGSAPDGSVETDGSTPDGSVETDGSTLDGGVGDVDGGMTGGDSGASAPSDAASGDGASVREEASSDPGGCGCGDIEARSSSASPIAVLAIGFVWLMSRRRRRGPRA